MASTKSTPGSAGESQQPSIEEQTRYYDEWNLACRSGDFDEVDFKVRTRAAVILEWLSELNRTDLQILEIGCGTGWLTEKLTDFGDVVAIDLSPAAVGIAELRKTGAKVLAGDFMTQEFPLASFDVVVCVETLFYVIDQDALLKKSHSLLREQGWFAATTVNKFVYERNSVIGAADEGQVRRWLSKRELKRKISKFYKISSLRSILPEGDIGVLRLVNSHKINKILKRFFGRESIDTLKERLGFGGGLVILAKKRD